MILYIVNLVTAAALAAVTVWLLVEAGVPIAGAVLIGISLGTLWVIWRWMRGKL